METWTKILTKSKKFPMHTPAISLKKVSPKIFAWELTWLDFLLFLVGGGWGGVLDELVWARCNHPWREVLFGDLVGWYILLLLWAFTTKEICMCAFIGFLCDLVAYSLQQLFVGSSCLNAFTLLSSYPFTQ